MNRELLQQVLQEFTEELRPSLKGPIVASISDIGTAAPVGMYDSLDQNATCISVMVLRDDMPLMNGKRFPSEFQGLPVVIFAI